GTGPSGRPPWLRPRPTSGAAAEEEAYRRSPCEEEEEEAAAAGKWRCPEHSSREAELFCGHCRRCVCALCPVLGAHRGHPVRLIREEAVLKQVVTADVSKLKKLTNECLKKLAFKKKQEVDNIKQISKAADDLKNHALASKTWLTEKFTQLRLLLDEEEALAKKFIDKNTEHALRTYDEQVDLCQDQINDISSFSDQVRRIQKQLDPVQLLQDYTATEKEIQQQMIPAEQWHPVPVTFEHVKNYFKCFAGAVQNNVQTPLEVRLKEVFSRYGKLLVSPDPTLKKGTFSSCRNSTAIYKTEQGVLFIR
uniref:B box-type domain-containing protein n=1 Tax=Ornithorhynchus anatinus TaxID=9258 RepID=A0A6I8NYM2_ORNAN